MTQHFEVLLLAFMATIYQSSKSCFKINSAPCHKTKVLSYWFNGPDNDFRDPPWPSPVTKSESNGTPLGSGRTVESQLGSEPDESGIA